MKTRVVKSLEECYFAAKEHIKATGYDGSHYDKHEAIMDLDMAICTIAHHGWDIEEVAGQLLDQWERQNKTCREE